MELIPAVDLQEGRCVRLLQGDFDAVTVFDARPAELGRRYGAAGAAWLHVVDLDGARSGERANGDALDELAGLGAPRLQCGGGVRSRAAAEDLFARGVERVVVGSLALEAPDEFRSWLEAWGPERVVLACDVRCGAAGADPLVLTHGWQRTSRSSLWAALEAFLDDGLVHVLCTDVERDGALAGPNLALYAACAERYPGLRFQASGGLAGPEDLARLAGTGASAAICGRALLEGRIPLEEVQRYSRDD